MAGHLHPHLHVKYCNQSCSCSMLTCCLWAHVMLQYEQGSICQEGVGVLQTRRALQTISAGLLGTHIESMRVVGKYSICSDGHEAPPYALRKMCNKRQCFGDAVMSPSTAVICRGLPLRQKNPWYCTLPSLQENELFNTEKLCTSGHSSTAQSPAHKLCQYESHKTAYHLPNMIRNWFALKDSMLPRV